jgi:hypothetical protein
MVKCITLIITLSLIPGSVSADKIQEGVPAEISMAFKAGNAEIIAEYLNSTVELVMPDSEDFYRKAVAEGILKEFFSINRTIDFVIKHQGGRSDARYAIGDLRTSTGTYRIYFLMKNVDGKPLIHQLRIEKDDEGSN